MTVETLTGSPTNPSRSGSLSNTTTVWTKPDNANTDFGSPAYYSSSAEDGLYVLKAASAATVGRYANIAFRFSFDTSSFSNITDLTCIWKGLLGIGGDSPDFQVLQVYSGSASTWVNWLTTLPDVNTEYTKSLGDGIGYGSGSYVVFGLLVEGMKEVVTPVYNLNVDYAALQITYGGAPPPSMAPKIYSDGLTWIVRY